MNDFESPSLESVNFGKALPPDFEDSEIALSKTRTVAED